jgi:hypothetical protein
LVTYEIASTLCGEPGQWESEIESWEIGRGEGSEKVSGVLVFVTRMMVVEEEQKDRAWKQAMVKVVFSTRLPLPAWPIFWPETCEERACRLQEPG